MPSRPDLSDIAIVDRYRRGETSIAIADRYGTTAGTVLARLRANGVWIRPRLTVHYAVCTRCRGIKRRSEFHRRRGLCKECQRVIANERYRQERRRRNAARHDLLYERGRRRRALVREAIRLRRAGVNSYQITQRLGVDNATIRRWTDDYRPTRDERIVRAYLEEEVSQFALGVRFGLTQQHIGVILRRAGIQCRSRGYRSASDRTVGGLAQAVLKRPGPGAYLPRSGWMKGDRLTRKQYDILEILRASLEPLTTARIRQVAESLVEGGKARWSLTTTSINGTVQALRRRGFVDGAATERMNAGRPLLAYFICDAEEVQRPLSLDEARRQAEIRKLVDEQAVDDRDRVKITGALSLDAPLTDDGLTRLERVGELDPELLALEEVA